MWIPLRVVKDMVFHRAQISFAARLIHALAQMVLRPQVQNAPRVAQFAQAATQVFL
jgi:hypothetical protein